MAAKRSCSPSRVRLLHLAVRAGMCHPRPAVVGIHRLVALDVLHVELARRELQRDALRQLHVPATALSASRRLALLLDALPLQPILGGAILSHTTRDDTCTRC